MKVLLAPIGSRGDVQPQLVLGEELRRRGHSVMLAAPPDFRELAASYGLPFTPIGDPVGPMILRNSAMTERNPAAALPAQLGLLRGYIGEQVHDLLSAKVEADVIVAAGLSLAAKVLADKLGVPHVFCCYSLSAMRSAAHPPAVLPLFGMPRLVNRALWGGLTLLFDTALGSAINHYRKRVGLPRDRAAWRAVHGSEVILAQDTVMGELPPDAPGRNVQVPALVPRPDAARPLSDSLERFLRGAGVGSATPSPVVYLGFGSMPSTDRARVVALASELFEQHGARVILYSAHEEERGVELPPGVFSCSDADHASLFPRVDLIVHHGGAGTTAAALRSGVPQLVVPHIVDQFFHGRRVAELGVGPAPVPKARLSAALVAEALSKRFDYWAKAQSVRAQVSAEGGARAAADHLERLVAAR